MGVKWEYVCVGVKWEWKFDYFYDLAVLTYRQFFLKAIGNQKESLFRYFVNEIIDLQNLEWIFANDIVLVYF